MATQGWSLRCQKAGPTDGFILTRASSPICALQGGTCNKSPEGAKRGPWDQSSTSISTSATLLLPVLSPRPTLRPILPERNSRFCIPQPLHRLPGLPPGCLTERRQERLRA